MKMLEKKPTGCWSDDDRWLRRLSQCDEFSPKPVAIGNVQDLHFFELN